MSDINKFLTSFKETELARPCNFDVSIFPTSLELSSALLIAAGKAGVNPSEAFKRIQLRCSRAELPSRTFNAVAQKTYGPEELHPVQNFYNKINLTFICSDDMFERFMFESWLNYISNASFFPFPNSAEDIVDMIDIDNMIGSSEGDFSYRPNVNYDFSYRNTYESFILITQYNVEGTGSYYCGLFHAFPLSVNESSLSWDAVNEHHTVTVTFAYTYFNSATTRENFPIPII